VDTFAVRAGMMFDGISVYGPSTILVQEGKIARVDPTGAPPPPDVGLVDLGADAFLMPGLIDAHVHLAFNGSLDVTAPDDELLDRMRNAATRALRAGITTVRDLGDRGYLSLKLRDEMEQQTRPEILAAGPPITTPGGHGYFLGGEASGREELVAAVNERYERGCAVIKVIASGGSTPGSLPYVSQYSAEDLRLIADEAHRLGLPVAAHAHAPSAIVDALDAGFDTLEHVSFWRADGLRPDPAVMARLARNGVVVSLTVGAVPGVGSELPNSSRDVIETYRAVCGQLSRSGATVVAGTDAGVSSAKPHDILPYGVAELAAGGLTPAAALAAVTSVAARACAVADRKGRIAVGADADLLAVAGNPLEDLNRLRNVRAVYKGGARIR
jgi:imidazolonepropionase-like amidohydrolase